MWLGFATNEVIASVFVLALFWEIIEWRIENWKPYGSLRAWAEDSFLDVFIAVMSAWWITL